MTKDEAMKLALEALEQLDGIDTETECVTIDVGDVITALREALAEQLTPDKYNRKLRQQLEREWVELDAIRRAEQPAPVQQEPVGKAHLCDRCSTPFDGEDECPECGHGSATKKQVYAAPQPEQQQEPVAALLMQSKQNFERNFGSNGYADWIYKDLAELLEASPHPAPGVYLIKEGSLDEHALYKVFDGQNWYFGAADISGALQVAWNGGAGREFDLRGPRTQPIRAAILSKQDAKKLVKIVSLARKYIPQPVQQETINGRTVAVDWKAQALELREIVRLGGIKIAELEAALAQQQEPVGYVAENGLVDWNLCAPPIFTDLYTSPSNQPGYQAMAMAVTRLQKRCLELEGKQPAQQEMPDDWFKGMPEEYRREAWRIKEQPAPVQEPVAWMHEWEDGERIPTLHPRDARESDKPTSVRPLVYGDTSPSAHRKPLMEEEMFEAIRPLYSSDKAARLAVSHSKDEYRAIEAKLKEKKTC